MALGFKEKRSLQKEKQAALEQIKAGSLAFKAKREVQKRISEITALLSGAKQIGSTIVDRFLNGDFDTLAAAQFREKLVELSKVVDESDTELFQRVVEKTNAYLVAAI